jgi:hypothetical protein
LEALLVLFECLGILVASLEFKKAYLLINMLFRRCFNYLSEVENRKQILDVETCSDEPSSAILACRVSQRQPAYFRRK